MTARHRTILLLLLSALLIPFMSVQNIFSVQENFFYDVILQMRPVQKVSPDIAIIEVDDRTLSQLGQWPLPRDFHATLVNILGELGAKVIVFDVLFSEPTEYDAAFAESIKNFRNVFLPEVFDFSEQASAKKILEQVNPKLTPLTQALDQAVPGHGHINIFVDPDGKIRRIPLFIGQQGGIVPQLSLRAACAFLGKDCTKTEFEDKSVTIDQTIKIPVSDRNEFLINYPGRWKQTFGHFSYLEIIALYKNWKTQQSGMGRLAELKGKACFIGLTAAGTVDLGASPLETNYPMVGLNASLFNSVVEKQFLRRAPAFWNIAIALALYLICLRIGMSYKPLQAFLGCIALAGLLLVGAATTLNYFGIWVDMFLPLLIIAAVYMACASARWAKERLQREMLEKEIMLAQKIQMQFLESPRQSAHNFDAAVWFRPAKYVSGDFYEVCQLDSNHAGIFLGDVSGKGLSAALCMAQSISLLRIFSQQEPTPEATLTRINKELCLRNSERFVTALYCVVDTVSGAIRAASAGHGPLYIYRGREKKLEEVPLPSRKPLGLMEESTYSSVSLQVGPDDKIFLLSDGVSEARTENGRELGMDKIKACFIDNAANSNKKICDALQALISGYAGPGMDHDDMTMVIFSLKTQS